MGAVLTAAPTLREGVRMIEFIDDDIQEVMQITGLDKDKATKLFKSVAKDIDDGTDDEICSYDVIDVIKVEQKAKENGVDRSIYVQSDKPREKAKRETKLDDTKVHFLKMLKTLMDGMEATDGVTNVSIVNPQKEIAFKIGDDNYSISLIKHRPPKAKK